MSLGIHEESPIQMTFKQEGILNQDQLYPIKELTIHDGGVEVEIKWSCPYRKPLIYLAIFCIPLAFFRSYLVVASILFALLAWRLPKKPMPLGNAIHEDVQVASKGYEKLLNLFKTKQVVLDAQAYLKREKYGPYDAIMNEVSTLQFKESKQALMAMLETKCSEQFVSYDRAFLFENNTFFVYKDKKLLAFSGDRLAVTSQAISVLQEEKPLNKDKMIDAFWEYSKKDGTADKRYKQNRYFYLCEYDLVEVLYDGKLIIELLTQ